MKPIEAAKLLYQNGEIHEAESILRAIWDQVQLKDPTESFSVLCALLEVGVAKDPKPILKFLENLISGDGEFQSIWESRTLSQQGSLFEWHGHLSFLIGDESNALDSLTRSASLGCDNSLLWYQLGILFIKNGDLELGLRYAKRSLQLFKQLDLNLIKSSSYTVGSFGMKHPMGFSHGVSEYLELLLDATKLAKSQKSLKFVREFIVEMIHQFPEEPRLPKIRLLMEQNIVSGALQQRPTISL